MIEPIILNVERKKIDPKDYKFRGAIEADYDTLITRPSIICDPNEDGRVKIVYLELEDDCTDLVNVLNRIGYPKDSRTDGLVSQSRTIGYQPRVPLRRDFCTSASLSNDDPQGHAIVTEYANKVAQYYQQYNPSLYQQHQQEVESVLPEWRMENSIFTSGIINKDNPLLYHFDSGNFKNVWSNMLVFKKDVSGGYLSCPEFNIGFELKNNSLLMFDGQNILHGVTPISRLKKNGHRYSIVFYSLQQMWHCNTPGEELKRIKKVRTEREENWLQRQLTGEVYLSPKKQRIDREASNI